MKPLFHYSKIAFFIAFITSASFAQDVCMVTSDFQTGEHYMVIYNKPADITGIDSVLFFRRQGQETVFTQIGSQSINELSYFKHIRHNKIRHKT
jgi:hypothetical protein